MSFGRAQLHEVVISRAPTAASDAPGAAVALHMVYQTRKFWLTEFLTFSRVGYNFNWRLWDGIPPCLVARSLAEEMMSVGEASGGM
jgi:hypothetical protein